MSDNKNTEIKDIQSSDNTTISNENLENSKSDSNDIDCNDCIDCNECDNCLDCECDFDSDSEEYQKFIDNMNNEFISFQNIYQQYCTSNNLKPNDMEMMALMDILKGGSGKFVCLAGEDDIAEEDKEFVISYDEYNKNLEKETSE